MASLYSYANPKKNPQQFFSVNLSKPKSVKNLSRTIPAVLKQFLSHILSYVTENARCIAKNVKVV